MLSIYLGDMEEAIYHPPTYFDNTYEDEDSRRKRIDNQSSAYYGFWRRTF